MNIRKRRKGLKHKQLVTYYINNYNNCRTERFNALLNYILFQNATLIIIAK